MVITANLGTNGSKVEIWLKKKLSNLKSQSSTIDGPAPDEANEKKLKVQTLMEN